MKVTIKDIAKATHVSISAVSLALNSKPGVSEKTKDLILQTAKEMGYRPTAKSEPLQADQIVRVLKIKRHGHTINSSHNFFIDAYIEGINLVARSSGVTLQIGTYDTDTSITEIAYKMDHAPQFIGYLILGTELSSNDVTTLLATGKNIVFMDTFLDYIPADFVDMNNTDAVYKIVNYLKKHGHTQIGLIKSSVHTRNFFLREKAFYQVMKDLDLTFNKNYIIDVDSTFEGSHRDTLKYLKKHDQLQLPTAFFAINDIIAFGSMKAFQEKGYIIPGDISFIAFDNLPMGSMVSPSLTTIDVSKHKIGQNALTMLLSKSKSNKCTSPMKTMIGGQLIERDSVSDLNK